MSESPKKNKLTPVQKVKFMETAKSIVPINKELRNGVEVVVSKCVFVFLLRLYSAYFVLFLCPEKVSLGSNIRASIKRLQMNSLMETYLSVFFFP